MNTSPKKNEKQKMTKTKSTAPLGTFNNRMNTAYLEYPKILACDFTISCHILELHESDFTRYWIIKPANETDQTLKNDELPKMLINNLTPKLLDNMFTHRFHAKSRQRQT